MKCLSTADWHIQDSTIEEAEKCLDFLVQTAETEQPDVIIHAGDTFNSGDVKLDSKAAKLVIRTFNRLADIAPVAVILGTPSHDGTAAEILSFVRGQFPIHVAIRPEQLYFAYHDRLDCEPHFMDIERAVMVGGCDAVISLMPAPTKQFFQGSGDIKQGDAEIAAAMSAIFAGFGATAAGFPAPHILVGHWNTTGSLISETQVLTGVDIEISTDQMHLTHACLCCLGHIHKAQDLRRGVFYSGSLFANTWGELDDKGFYIHEIGDEVVSRFVKGPSRKMIRFSNDFTKNGVPDNLLELMAPTQDITGAHIRLDLSVYQDEAEKIDKQAIETAIMHTAASCDIRVTRIPRENIRADAVLKADSLRDKLIAAAALRDEKVSESILQKADALENMDPEELVKMIGKGVGK